ncbi:MAG: flagella basal body P-ring formation protein FlgA [Verrucomicrobia bacterium Tous-C9LFEB]|nr:MAG: flagella basal body P-ring formation protein FlgA [Verrucomicrobia bacterium Tous-C9LFEB]
MFILWFQSYLRKRPYGGTFFIQFLPLLALLFLLSPATAAVIELKENAAISSGAILLGDIATVTGATPANLSTLPLGASPLAGTATRWTRDAVAQVILAKYPQEKIVWQGGVLWCRVERPGRSLQGEEVQARLEEELTKITRGAGEARIKEINSWSDLVVPQGPLEFSFEFASTTLRSAWAGANMKITINGEPVLARSVRFRWSWMRPGWQAKTNLAAGQPLDLKDFEAVTVDVLTQPTPIYIGEELPQDSCLTRGCVAGRLLTASDMKPQTLVKRGSPVTLRYTKGGLTIQLQALALQDGARGQIIAVQNATTRKKLMARVTDEMTLDYVQ